MVPDSVPDTRDQRHDRQDRGDTRRHAPLEAPGLPDADERAHQEAEVEAGGMDDQSFEDVLMTTQMRAAHAAGVVQMRIRSFEQFSALTQEALAASAAHAPTVRVHRALGVRRVGPASAPDASVPKCTSACPGSAGP